VIPVTSQCNAVTDKFRRYSVPESRSITDYMTGESIFSPVVGICLLRCTEGEKCRGMIYDVPTKRCFLKECLNPHLFVNWNESDSNYSIQILQRINVEPNKLLARGMEC